MSESLTDAELVELQRLQQDALVSTWHPENWDDATVARLSSGSTSAQVAWRYIRAAVVAVPRLLDEIERLRGDEYFHAGLRRASELGFQAGLEAAAELVEAFDMSIQTIHDWHFHRIAAAIRELKS